jgi:aromatic-amino-acid transaminase
MLEALHSYAPGTLVVLHACCHNPTGVDLTDEQWKKVVACMETRKLVPFIDMAYQGFSQGIEEDAMAVRLLAEAGVEGFVANSFSKTFSLYGERVGALSVITTSQDAAQRVLSQLKRTIRANYSNPSTHGAAIVSRILNDAALRSVWAEELNEMRERIRTLRSTLVTQLMQQGAKRNFDFINCQHGMFSYSGLNANQVAQLQSEFGIYAVNSGRICVAALNTKNVETVAKAIVQVM